MNEKLGQVVDVTNSHSSVLKTMAYKSIDLEARSRRNNLIFWGFVEIPNENCFAIIRGFLADRLNLDPQNIYISRAHRLGPRKIGIRNPRRPIIVNFRDFCDTEMIMDRVHLLRNTPYSVGYDLPKEINDARKNLWHELKDIKSKQPSSKVQIVYPAKLIVDGKVIRDEFPDWNNAMRNSSLSYDFAHIYRNCIFEHEQSNMNSDMQTSERPTTIRSCWGDGVVSDATIHSKTHSISSCMNEPAETRDHDMGQNDGSNNVIGQPPEPIEMAVFNRSGNDNAQKSYDVSDWSRSSSMQRRSRSISPEKRTLFRPIDQSVGTTQGTGESNETLTLRNTHNIIPAGSQSAERKSRPKERGLIRPSSFSPAERVLAKTVTNKTGSTSSINKQTVTQNRSLSKQTHSGGQANTSQDNTSTQSVTVNRSSSMNDAKSD